MEVTKFCGKCKELKDLTLFSKNKSQSDGFNCWCKECFREYYQANKDKLDKRNREWHINNKEAIVAHKFKHELQKRYCLPVDTYNSMVREQEGRCYICREYCTTHSRLSVDHCHKSGEVRKLLCRRCNVTLGNVGDSEEILKSMINYLEEYK